MTLFAWIARYPGAVWDDMLEAWSWGQHFQLGYYKHPPFYAWVAGVWLRIFPRKDFSFYLLSGSLQESPWITPERIAREGILYACAASDLDCIEAAKTYATAQTTRLLLIYHSAFWGLRGSAIEVLLIMTPPRIMP
jgi:hypothetical protein